VLHGTKIVASTTLVRVETSGGTPALSGTPNVAAPGQHAQETVAVAVVAAVELDQPSATRGCTAMRIAVIVASFPT
jgi:hypothetical protein